MESLNTNEAPVKSPEVFLLVKKWHKYINENVDHWKVAKQEGAGNSMSDKNSSHGR